MRHATVKDFEKSISGGEPTWNNNEVSLVRALNWYNTHSDSKESKKFAVQYFKETKESKSNITTLEKVAEKDFKNLGFVCRMKLRGAPLEDKHVKWIKSFTNELISKEKRVVVAPIDIEVKPTVSIQERVGEKAHEYLGELDGALDDCFLVRDFSTDVFKPYEFFQSLGMKGTYSKYVVAHCKKLIAEFTEVLNSKDDVLKEGYSNFSKPVLKSYINFLNLIITDAEKLAHNSKIVRAPKKKKAKPVEKVIGKLKFKKDDNELKLVSINPSDIIGASQLWIFNTKTRKLGCYISSDTSGLTVRGTTLTNFDEVASVQKTIRKPDVMLPTVSKVTKTVLKKTFADIKSTGQPLTGRLNSDTILFRVIK